MVADLALLQDRATLRTAAIPEQPIFSSSLVVDFNSPSEPSRIGHFDPFEIDLDEDGPLREEYVPRRRSSVKKDGSQYSSMAGSDESMSPRELPDWATRAHWSDTRGLDAHFRPSALIRPLPGTLAHAQSSWAEPERNSVPPPLPCRPDLGNPQFSRDFFGMGFHPVPTRPVIPTGHSRTSSISSRSSAHAVDHFSSSYSQAPMGGNGACYPLPIPCSRYAGYSAFFQSQGNPCYFQPMWLKT